MVSTVDIMYYSRYPNRGINSKWKGLLQLLYLNIDEFKTLLLPEC